VVARSVVLYDCHLHGCCSLSWRAVRACVSVARRVPSMTTIAHVTQHLVGVVADVLTRVCLFVCLFVCFVFAHGGVQAWSDKLSSSSRTSRRGGRTTSLDASCGSALSRHCCLHLLPLLVAAHAPLLLWTEQITCRHHVRQERFVGCFALTIPLLRTSSFSPETLTPSLCVRKRARRRKVQRDLAHRRMGFDRVRHGGLHQGSGARWSLEAPSALVSAVHCSFCVDR
jgi:hypothetical protein